MPIFQKAYRALEKARSVDEVKAVRDKAQAAALYARQAKLGKAMVDHACEIKLRAERKAGVLLARQGLRPGRNSDRVSLKDLDLARHQSSRWQAVASIPEEVFESYITEARASATREITTAGALLIARELQRKGIVAALRCKRSRGGRVDDLVSVSGRYRCIYADPPWQYRDRGVRGAAEKHYATLWVEELCELPVGELAKKTGAHLWLWCTWPMIYEGAPHRLLEAWGYRWVGHLTWDKIVIGTGHWLRSQDEVLALAVKGKSPPPLLERDQGTVVRVQKNGHSKKPEEFYKILERLSPGPRMELFARQARVDWCRWGEEA